MMLYKFLLPNSSSGRNYGLSGGGRIAATERDNNIIE